MSDDNFWEHEEFDCPHCQMPLARVNHPGMADDWELYCDQCANRIWVSFYDDVVTSFRQNDSDFEELITYVEACLRPCDCGEKYGFRAPRRCPRCMHIIIDGVFGVDLWPRDYFLDPDELAPDQNAKINTFFEKHLRTDDIWTK